MQRLPYLGVFSLFIVSLAISGCKKEAPAPEVVKIGTAGPMTGDQSAFGQDQQNGVRLAVDEWNRRGGVLGKKIELLVGDDQHDPKQAVFVANKMVNEGVTGMVGHFNSSCSIPASRIYNEQRIPMITHGSTNPELTEQGFKGVFRVCGRDDQQGVKAAEYVINELKISSVAILHDKTTYGQGLADEFRKGVEGKVKVTYHGGVTQGDKDFSAVLTNIKTGNPELIYFGGIYPEGGLLVKQARALGIKAPFMSGDGVIGEEFLKIAGSDAEWTYVTFAPDVNKIPSAEGFVEAYTSKYGKPGPYSVYAYVAANILLQGVKDANSTDGARISEAIHRMKYDGALGAIEFDEKGDVKVSPYVIWQVKGGKWEQITK
jgi:branched-chain amino acid transport system substrate-binding protein